MNNPGKVASWLQVISNIAIVIGLGLVGLQMKQTSEITSLQLLSEYMSDVNDGYAQASGEALPEAWARAQMNVSDLTDAELSVVRYFLQRQWVAHLRMAELRMSGYLDAQPSPGEVQGWINLLGNETALRWWAAEHDRVLRTFSELRDAVDERLQAAGPEQHTVHRRLLEQMRSGPLPMMGVDH